MYRTAAEMFSANNHRVRPCRPTACKRVDPARSCTYREDLWARPAIGTDLAHLERLSYHLLRAAQQVKSTQPWQLPAMLAGYHGGEQRKPWGNLLALIDEAWDCYSKSQELYVCHEPELPEELPMEESRTTSEQISMHLVGHYVIDLVIENNGKRLAVECDGDRFYPLERLPDDMARLAVLQRLGWTFVRIRGSRFLRDPDGAMEPVLAELRAVDIEPVVPGENGEAAKTQDLELRDRVVRRAQEIRRTWRAEDSMAARFTHRDCRHGSTRRRISKGLGP